MIGSCTDELIGMVHTATWGSADLRRAGKVMTRAGTGGAGRLDHVNLRKEGQIARATSSYEVGGWVDMHQTTKDGLMYVTTPNRMYIVRDDFSGSLGAWEARVTGPQDMDCSIVVHLTGKRYQVMTSGNMTCYSPEGVGRLQWNRAGDTFRLFRGEPSCSTRCLSVGPRGFKVDLRTLDTIPTVHPAMLREVSTFQGAPNPLDINTDKQTFNRLHDIIQKDVKENKDMLTDMHDKDDKEDTWQIDNWKIGLGGTLTLATTAACAALLFCLLRRGATCCRPDRPPPQVNVPLSVNVLGIEEKLYKRLGS